MLVKKFLCMLLVVFAALPLWGCGGQNGDTQTETGKSAGEIAIFYHSYEDDYLAGVRSSLNEELASAGVLHQDYNSENNQSLQNEQIAQAIAEGASMLLVDIVEEYDNEAAQAVVNQAKAAKLPLIFFHGEVSEWVVTTYDQCIYVRRDDAGVGITQGRMIGDYLLENYDEVDRNQDGKISYVIFTGDETDEDSLSRTQYSPIMINNYLNREKKPAIVYFDRMSTKRYLADPKGAWSFDAAKDYMSDVLRRYNEKNGNLIELVIACNDEMALGAAAALREADVESVPVFGIGATEAGKQAIHAGYMTGTLEKDSPSMGETLALLVNNFRTPGRSYFYDVPPGEVEGTWRVNVPYSYYLGE